MSEFGDSDQAAYLNGAKSWDPGMTAGPPVSDEHAPASGGNLASSGANGASAAPVFEGMFDGPVTGAPESGGEKPESAGGEKPSFMEKAVETVPDMTDLMGRGLDLYGHDKAASVLDLPSSIRLLGRGFQGMSDGKQGSGNDIISGGGGLLGDAATLMGDESLSQGSNMVKSGSQIGKGIGELGDGISSGEAQQEVNGISDLLRGGADMASAGGGSSPIGKVGKALGFGMAWGDAMAPVVFGDKKEDAGKQTADGQWHASTGNGPIDWMIGAGKYTNSRFGDDSAPPAAPRDTSNPNQDVLPSEMFQHMGDLQWMQGHFAYMDKDDDVVPPSTGAGGGVDDGAGGGGAG